MNIQLAAPEATPTPRAPPPAAPEDVTRISEEEFRLQVELDLAHEGLVLWRMVLVVELIATLLLVREWVSVWIGP